MKPIHSIIYDRFVCFSSVFAPHFFSTANYVDYGVPFHTFLGGLNLFENKKNKTKKFLVDLRFRN